MWLRENKVKCVAYVGLCGQIRLVKSSFEGGGVSKLKGGGKPPTCPRRCEEPASMPVFAAADQPETLKTPQLINQNNKRVSCGFDFLRQRLTAWGRTRHQMPGFPSKYLGRQPSCKPSRSKIRRHW